MLKKQKDCICSKEKNTPDENPKRSVQSVIRSFGRQIFLNFIFNEAKDRWNLVWRDKDPSDAFVDFLKNLFNDFFEWF